MLTTPDSNVVPVREALDLAGEPDFAIGPMSVKPSASEIDLAGGAHKIEPRVMQVLVALAHAKGAVVSRSDLIEVCWGGVIVGEDAINRVVGRIRRLAELSEPPAFRVETIPKIGYRLIRPAACEEAARPGAVRLNVAPAAPAARPRRFLRLSLALAAMTAAAAALVLLAPRRAPDPHADKMITVAAPRLAVMPFDVEGAGEEQGYLAEGIAEEIHDRLTQFENLEVVGLSSAVALGGVTDDVQELGRRLGASFVLQGELKRDGESLRLDMRLVDSRDGGEIWADWFEGAIKDVSTLEGEIARAIAGALSVAPPSAAAPDISAENPDAYELYLRGLAAFRRYETGGEDGAIALLSRAVDLDPTLNAARARLALSYAVHAENQRAEGNFAAHARTLKLSSETALAALAIEPQNAVALTALGAVHKQQKLYNEAQTLLNYVRDIAPEEEAATIDHSLLLAIAGYTEEAKALTSDAMRINPASARVVGFLAAYELLLGDYESALGHAEFAYSLKFSAGAWVYAISLAAVGRADDAADLLAAELAATAWSEQRLQRENFRRMTIGAFTDDAGRERYAAAIRTRLDENDSMLAYGGEAQILNLLGEAELRDRFLLYMIDTGFFDRDPLAAMDLWAPWASNVRATPQFKDLVTRLRFVPYWKEHGWPKGCRPTGADDFECG